jgi:hypothetical protein
MRYINTAPNGTVAVRQFAGGGKSNPFGSRGLFECDPFDDSVFLGFDLGQDADRLRL